MIFRYIFHTCLIVHVVFAAHQKAAFVAGGRVVHSLPQENRRSSITMTVQEKLKSRPAQVAFVSLLAAGVVAAGFISTPWTRTYLTATDIPDRMFASQRIIKGTVASVADGDTFRLKHEPTISFGRKKGGKLSETTISIRIYGVDAPETQHGASQAQPFGNEAKEFVREEILGKRVRVKLLRRDQYSRVIGSVKYGGIGPFGRKDLSIQLLRKGYGTMYYGGGAEYDGKKEEMESIVKAAQRKRVGIWANGATIETPAQYKAKQKAALNVV